MSSDEFKIKNEFYVTRINEYLKNYFVDIKEPEQIVVSAMKYSLLNGGKRVRGVLVLAFCELLEIDIEKALPFACAVEMVHCYSLIHDDLPCMDNDDFRRGQPSCHIKYGENIALLAGDALLTEAFLLISNSSVSFEIKVNIVKELALSIGHTGMIAGQAIDLFCENKKIDINLLNRLHNLKTSKLITFSCQVSSVMALKDFEITREYGENIGLIFQIVDDILDVTSTQEMLGKPINSDINNAKSTYVTLLSLKDAKNTVLNLAKISKELLQKHYAKNSDFLCNMVDFLVNRKF